MTEGQARVGWIGTGVIGSAICGHLLAAGYVVTVFNRTRERADGVVEAGALWRSSPAEVAADADVVLTMVGFPSDVREVVLSTDGVLSGAQAGSLIVEMTTSDRSLAREIHDVARLKEVDALDAPVSGGDVGARNATLVVVVGGAEAAFERVPPLFQTFIKDLGMALAEAARMDLSLPGLALTHQLYVAVRAQGHGQLGTHALAIALASLSHLDSSLGATASSSAPTA